MTNEVVDRLKLIYKEECGSINKLSEKIGVSVDTLKNVFSRGSKPNFEVILKFSEYFPNYSMDWLFRGEGSKYRHDNSSIGVKGEDGKKMDSELNPFKYDELIKVIHNMSEFASKSAESEKIKASADLLRAEAALKNADAEQNNVVNIRLMLEMIAAKDSPVNLSEIEKKVKEIRNNL